MRRRWCSVANPVTVGACGDSGQPGRHLQREWRGRYHQSTGVTNARDSVYALERDDGTNLVGSWSDWSSIGELSNVGSLNGCHSDQIAVRATYLVEFREDVNVKVHQGRMFRGKIEQALRCR